MYTRGRKPHRQSLTALSYGSKHRPHASADQGSRSAGVGRGRPAKRPGTDRNSGNHVQSSSVRFGVSVRLALAGVLFSLAGIAAAKPAQPATASTAVHPADLAAGRAGPAAGPGPGKARARPDDAHDAAPESRPADHGRHHHDQARGSGHLSDRLDPGRRQQRRRRRRVRLAGEVAASWSMPSTARQ